MQLSYILLPLLAAAATAKSTVYLIRHGEKPADGGENLSAQGEQRAQCLRGVFGHQSKYNIQYIIAQTPKSNGKRARPLETVQPLANDLGLSVDTSCDRDDSKCVNKLVKAYNKRSGKGNILICWEHHELTSIVEALGDGNAPTYPDSSFNIIWKDPSPYNSITQMSSEHCQGLDS